MFENLHRTTPFRTKSFWGQKKAERPISRVLCPCGYRSSIWDCSYLQPQATNPGSESGPLHSPVRSCSGRGFPDPFVTERPVRSYRTISPLPVSLRTIGGVFSVALSVPRRFLAWSLGVTQRPALWSPDFPHLPRRKTRPTSRSADSF